MLTPTVDDALSEIDYLKEQMTDLELDNEGWMRNTHTAEKEVLNLRHAIYRAMDEMPFTEETKEARRILRLARVRSEHRLKLEVPSASSS